MARSIPLETAAKVLRALVLEHTDEQEAAALRLGADALDRLVAASHPGVKDGASGDPGVNAALAELDRAVQPIVHWLGCVRGSRVQLPLDLAELLLGLPAARGRAQSLVNRRRAPVSLIGDGVHLIFGTTHFGCAAMLRQVTPEGRNIVRTTGATLIDAVERVLALCGLTWRDLDAAFCSETDLCKVAEVEDTFVAKLGAASRDDLRPRVRCDKFRDGYRELLLLGEQAEGQ